MEELDIQTIAKRSIHGVLALVSRTFFLNVVTLVANILLALYLSPAVFGVYFVVSAALAFLSYFSDIGLAAALIQKKESITDDDLKTTFTIQQSLVLSLVIIALLISPIIGSFYNLNNDGIFLFQALVISFFLSSLKTIPSILLERKLEFKKLVIPQIVETIAFNSIALVLAVNGFGILSFAYAVLARGLLGLITIYSIAPWRIRIGISKASSKKLLTFGIPFQTNSVLALLKDDLLSLYLGKVLPFAEVGYIGFAHKWALAPLRIAMDNMIRITFPVFSRIQHDKVALGKAIERTMFAISALVMPSLVGLVVLAPYFIRMISKYEKWEPALLSLSLFAISSALSSVSTPLTNALNAIGKVKVTLYLMVFWTLATWILTPFSIAFFGYNGVAFAAALISLSLFIVIYISKKYIQFDVFKIIYSPIFSSIVMGIAIYFVSQYVVGNLFTLFLMIPLGVIIYAGILYIISKEQIKQDIAFIKENLKK